MNDENDTGSPVSELQRLIDRCKADVHLEANMHKSDYASVEQYIDSRGGVDMMDVDPDELRLMVEADKMVSLQFYPRTPVGSYSLYGVDADALIAEAHRILDGG